MGLANVALALTVVVSAAVGAPPRAQPVHNVRSVLGVCHPESKLNLTVARVRGYFVIVPSTGLSEIGALFDTRTPDKGAYTEGVPAGGSIESLRVSRKGLLVGVPLQGPGHIRRGIPNDVWVVIRGRLSCIVYQSALGPRPWIGVQSWRRLSPRPG
jgi:hypothetical protein